MIMVLLFIFGIIIGSFLNAVVFRLHVGEQFISGRSHCIFCRHPLGFWDLIPIISFGLLKGRCRYCGKKISWQYPLVELAMGLIFVLGYWQRPVLDLNLLAYLVFSFFLALIFIYDLKYYLILDKVSFPAVAVAFIFNIFLGVSWLNMILAMVVVGGFFMLQFLLSSGRWIGGGDIRLGLLMGAMLSWPNALVALFLAYIIGAIFGLILIILKKKRWQSQLPFGTFLSAASLISLIWGDQILNWYLHGLL